MNRTTTFELCYSPADSDALVYRSIPAGICGPFTESQPCESREQAEQIARDHGFAIAGTWASHANFDSIPLRRTLELV